jgi:hypothetical protein
MVRCMPEITIPIEVCIENFIRRHVRSGSKAEVTPPHLDVGFTPESRPVDGFGFGR